VEYKCEFANRNVPDWSL